MGIMLAQSVHAEKVGSDAAAGTKNQGTLKTEGKEYTLFAFTDTESVTEAVSQFLQWANMQKSDPDALLKCFIYITPEFIEVESEIADLLLQLSSKAQDQPSTTGRTYSKGGLPQMNLASRNERSMHSTGKQQNENNSTLRENEGSYSSLFSLARSFNSALSGKREQVKQENAHNNRGHGREEVRSFLLSVCASPFERITQEQSRFERDGEGQQGQKGREEENDQGGQENPNNQERRQVVKKKRGVKGIVGAQASRERVWIASPSASRKKSSQSTAASAAPQEVVGGVENIYFRFMALMARILGQAEREAHELYQRIKERTDQVDLLTLLLSKINSEKGPIDWSKNEEMKSLIEKARAIGVDIPAGKLTWTDEEKKLFKENIQMRKDSLEKVTQLERTDMQRYLQEASQCHQARSNILKLLKEVNDTIIANMRP